MFKGQTLTIKKQLWYEDKSLYKDLKLVDIKDFEEFSYIFFLLFFKNNLYASNGKMKVLLKFIDVISTTTPSDLILTTPERISVLKPYIPMSILGFLVLLFPWHLK